MTQNYRRSNVNALHDFATGALIGLEGWDGRPYLLPVSAAFATNPQAATAYPGNFTTVSASGAVTFTNALTCNPANLAVSVAPSGTGNATFGASGTGSTTIQRVGSLSVLTTDTTGTPGNATINTLRGRAAFAIGASTCVITNSTVTATSTVLCVLQAADATLTDIIRVVPAAGSFTVTANATATAATAFSFLVVN